MLVAKSDHDGYDADLARARSRLSCSRAVLSASF